MVKFGNVKCDKCGQEMKKSRLALHKCTKVAAPTHEKCISCGKDIPAKNFARHYQACRAKGFWKLHMYFFLFFLRIIRTFNRELKKLRYLGCQQAKKRFIEEQTFVEGGKVDLRKNQSLLSTVLKVEEENVLSGVKVCANEQGFDLEDIDNAEAIKDSISYSSPGLSCRQLIFDFLKEKGIEDTTTIDLIDKKLFRRDYPTDEELEENPYLFNKIKKLRVQYDYHSYYERFYYMLVGYYANRDRYQCHLCKKFYLNMKRHMKNCKPYRELFYGHEEEAIQFYLKTFFNSDFWSQEKIDYYVNYYKNYSLNYFIETISEHVRHRRAFIDRILEGRRKFRILNGLAYHYSFRALVAEIDAWHPACFEELTEEKKAEKKYFNDLNHYFDPDYKEEDSFYDRFEAKIDEGGEEESKDMILPKDIEEEKEPSEETLRKTWVLLLGDKFKQKQEKKEESEEESSYSEDGNGLGKLAKNAKSLNK